MCSRVDIHIPGVVITLDEETGTSILDISKKRHPYSKIYFTAKMVLDTIRQLASQLPLLNGSVSITHHPFDPLSTTEIEKAVSIVRKDKPDLALHFNTVTLHEPRKAGMLAWLAAPTTAPRPPRVADIVAVAKGSKVYDGLVDLDAGTVTKWQLMTGVQPLITVEDLMVVEEVVRKDPKVIEQCGIIGIPKEDMHKVYCDPWTIGFDERWGSTVRLQQGELCLSLVV